MLQATDLTPQVLSGLLARVTGGASIRSVAAEPVGTGQMAVCLRLALTYEPGGAGPASVVAKIPSPDEGSRGAAATMRAYEVEVKLYQQLVDRLTVSTPAVYHATLGANPTDFLLLLQDVSPACQGDQLQGCGADQATAAVTQMVGLHAPLWGDPGLEDLEWLNRKAQRDTVVSAVQQLFPGFLERYADRLTPEVRRVSQLVVDQIETYVDAARGPLTVTHGDFRLDNLLFAGSGQDPQVWVVDWQTAVLGPGVNDLAYFIGGAFLPARRRSEEERLVRLYHRLITARGVHLDMDELWTSYRRAAFGGLLMAIIASMLVERTPRGDDMFMAMANRHGQQAIDLSSADLL